VLDAALPGGLIEGSGSLRYAQTMAFTTVLLFQLFNVLNARSDEQSAFNGVFENGWLWMAVILSLLLQVAVVYAPFPQEAFSTVSLSAGDWLVCGAEAARAEQDHHSGTPRRRSAWGQCRPRERPRVLTASFLAADVPR